MHRFCPVSSIVLEKSAESHIGLFDSIVQRVERLREGKPFLFGAQKNS